MDGLLLIIILALIGFIVFQKISSGKKNPTKQANPKEQFPESTEEKKPLPVKGAYQRNWLFSYNEKDAYQKLKPIAEELGYTVFAKVRLLDLVTPIKGNPKYKTYFYKVQAKHVDFVLCDEKLVARCVIELDDKSHDTEERQKRDSFVDEVLKSVGYKIIHTRAITDDLKKQINE